jgi:hypothetical protein
MVIKNNIAKAEQEFPRLFTFYEDRPYGTLFYNTKIKDHHDSNHAILYPEKIKNLNSVLIDIKNFYQSKDINPAIYPPPVENYFIENAILLKNNGFEFMTGLDARMMLLKTNEQMQLSNILDIRQIKDKDMIEKGSYFIEKDEYLTEIYRNCILKPNHYLFVGYYEEKPVALISFHVTEYNCTRFNEMKTAKAFMKRGFAREMNKFAVNFCINNQLPIAYQWPAHGTSERITSEAGFQVAFTLPIGGYASYAIQEHFILNK